MSIFWVWTVPCPLSTVRLSAQFFGGTTARISWWLPRQACAFTRGRSCRQSFFRSVFSISPWNPFCENPAVFSPSAAGAAKSRFLSAMRSTPGAGACPRATWRPLKPRSRPPSGSFLRKPDSLPPCFPSPLPRTNFSAAPALSSRSPTILRRWTANPVPCRERSAVFVGSAQVSFRTTCSQVPQRSVKHF